MPRSGTDTLLVALLQWQPGGRGAHQLLEKFVMSRLKAFSEDRSKTDTRSTSRLSPHIHYGEISVRHIYYVVPPPPFSPPFLDFVHQVSYPLLTFIHGCVYPRY